MSNLACSSSSVRGKIEDSRLQAAMEGPRGQAYWSLSLGSLGWCVCVCVALRGLTTGNWAYWRLPGMCLFAYSGTWVDKHGVAGAEEV